MYTLGIDIGTTNVKAVLFAEKAAAIAEAACEYETIFPHASWAEQHAQDWWSCSVTAIRSVLQKSGIDPVNVAAVAISCQAPTMLPVDRSGIPLRNALIWMDRRSDEQCRALVQAVGAERIFELTGNNADPYYVLGELMWFKEKEPELFERTYRVLMPNGYVNFRLTGEFSMDPVHASLTQCYDIRNRCWSQEMLSAAGVDASLFPAIAEGHAPTGQVSASAAAETGLAAGTAVLTGMVDGAAAALEAGVVGDGLAVEMSGTSSVLLMSTARPRPSRNLTYMYGAAPGQHLTLGAMSTTGAALKWFRDTLYTGPAQDAYAHMNAEVEQGAASPTNIVFLPYMAGERAPIWDSDARGTFVGLTLGTNRAQMIRAIMEGGALALRDNVEEAARAGISLSCLRSVGGHAKSEIWLKIKASVLNRAIEVPVATLGAPGGLAYLLGAYTGEFASIEDAARQCLRIGRTVEPVQAWAERYDELFASYRSIYAHIRGDFARMAKTSA